MDSPRSQKRPVQKTRRFRTGREDLLAQLSLVEHSLCPLDTKVSLVNDFIHQTYYYYTDANRNRKKAHVTVDCPQGLSAKDEFYLWGLLSLTFAEENPTPLFTATPYYCLKRLKAITTAKKGGEEFSHFRRSTTRLATVTYHSHPFYDPIRGEFCDVDPFSFLTIRRPHQPNSRRPWRFYWNPFFFELCEAVSGSFAFDLDLTRSLDDATRRLFLCTHKRFGRKKKPPESASFELKHLMDILGYSQTLETDKRKQRAIRSIQRLVNLEVFRLPEGLSARDCIVKKSRGVYAVTVYRGSYFGKRGRSKKLSAITDHRHYDVLKSLGFDDHAIVRIIRDYKPHLIDDWADIALAAQERKIIRKTPQAYFMDGIKRAATGQGRWPDWWLQLRKDEERVQREEQRRGSGFFFGDKARQAKEEKEFEEFLRTEVADEFHKKLQRVFRQFTDAGKNEPEAREYAEKMTRMHFRRRFQEQRTGSGTDSDPTHVGDLFYRN